VLQTLYEEFRARFEFAVIYIQEAHPTDGWQVPSNLVDGIEYAQPRTMEERRAVAADCCHALELSAPLYLDGMDNAVDQAFNAWPERLCVLAAGGRIVYRGERGPYGFDPLELEEFLERSESSQEARRFGGRSPDSDIHPAPLPS